MDTDDEYQNLIDSSCSFNCWLGTQRGGLDPDRKHNDGELVYNGRKYQLVEDNEELSKLLISFPKKFLQTMHRTLFIVQSLLFIQVSSCCFAQQSGKQNAIRQQHYLNEITQATALIQKLKTDNNIPGISVCIGWNNETIWSEGFGDANIENHVPATIETKFRIGSIAKSLTAVAMMKLVQEGKMNLDSTVTSYIDYWPLKKYPISIRQLASHQSGIRHYNMQKLEMLNRDHYSTVKESLDQFKSDSLLFEPGTKYSYSTFGYVLLSACMEQAAGEDFLSLMWHQLFQPLGMSNTVADINDSLIPNRASCYDIKNGKVVNAYYVDNSGKLAAGGFLSTPSDLVSLCQQLLSGKYLNQNSLKTLWTPNTLKNGDSTNYCFGFRKGKDSKGRTIIHHGGQAIGGRAFLMIYPDEKLVIAIACNSSANFAEQFGEQIAGCFLEKK